MEETLSAHCERHFTLNGTLVSLGYKSCSGGAGGRGLRTVCRGPLGGALSLTPVTCLEQTEHLICRGLNIYRLTLEPNGVKTNPRNEVGQKACVRNQLKPVWVNHLVMKLQQHVAQ